MNSVQGVHSVWLVLPVYLPAGHRMGSGSGLGLGLGLGFGFGLGLELGLGLWLGLESGSGFDACTVPAGHSLHIPSPPNSS